MPVVLNPIKSDHPFGMVMPGRNWTAASAEGYRFGFNGKESDSETYGDNNIYDYGFRIYNPRLGKFLSMDPLSKSYPMLTPYQFASNTPVWAIDLDGLEAITATEVKNTNDQGFDVMSDDNLDVAEDGSGGVFIRHTFELNTTLIYFSTGGVSTQEIAEASKKSKIYQYWFGIKHPQVVYYKNQIKGSLLLMKNFDGPTGFHNQFGKGLTGISKEKALDYKNTFRHIAGQALLTIVYGSDFADFIGDAHERDDNGYEGNRIDAITDLINNPYGQRVGKALSEKYDFTNPDNITAKNVASFLTEVSEYVINSFPELTGQSVKFSEGDADVLELTKALKTGN